MTEKFQHKDRPPQHMKAPGRFNKNGRNSRHNLLAKIDNLRATEALSPDTAEGFGNRGH